MSAPPYPNPQSVAVANALRAEPTTAEVTFPVTGDTALDLASGILAVIRETAAGLRPGQVLDVLRYLVAREERAEKENQLQAQAWAQGQGTVAGQVPSVAAGTAEWWRTLAKTYTGKMPQSPPRPSSPREAQLIEELKEGMLLRPPPAYITRNAEDLP